MESQIGIVACTRGFSIDYGYAADGCEKQTAFEFEKVLDDQEPSIAVHKRTDNTFGVSIGCIPTKQTDNVNRNTRLYLTFNGLTEEKSRDILLFYLERWKQWAEVTEPFLQAFHWNQKSTEQDKREWDVDFQKIRKIISDIPHVEATNKRLSDRWERNNNPTNISKLLELFNTHTFSLSSGFKVVVTGPAPTKDSYEQLRKEVDRYLWTGGRKEELKNPEPEKISNEDTPENEDSIKKNGVKCLVLIIIIIIEILVIMIGLYPRLGDWLNQQDVKYLKDLQKESKKDAKKGLQKESKKESKNSFPPIQIPITPPKEIKETQKEENKEEQEDQTPTIPTNQEPEPSPSPSDPGESPPPASDENKEEQEQY